MTLRQNAVQAIDNNNEGPDLDQISDSYPFNTIGGPAFVESTNIPSGPLNAPFNIDIRFNRPILKISLGSFIFDGIDLELPDLYYYDPYTGKDIQGWNLLSSFKSHETNPKAIVKDSSDRYYLVGNGRKALIRITFDLSDVTQPQIDESYVINPNIENFKGDSDEKFESMPSGLTWHNDELYMIGAENHALYKIDPSDGSISDKITCPTTKEFGVDETSPRGLVWHIDKFYMIGASNNRLYTIDPNNGGASTVNRSINGFGIGALEARGLITYNNNLYTFLIYRSSITQRIGGRLYTINRTTGRADKPVPKTPNKNIKFPVVESLTVIGDSIYIISSDEKGSLYKLDIGEPTTNLGLNHTEEVTKITRVQEKMGSGTTSSHRGYTDFQLRFDKPEENTEGNLNISLKANSVE